MANYGANLQAAIAGLKEIIRDPQAAPKTRLAAICKLVDIARPPQARKSGPRPPAVSAKIDRLKDEAGLLDLK